MKLSRVGMLGGLLSVAVFGCDDPGPIVSVSPPGATLPRENPDTETPSAQGEMPAPAASAATASTEYAPAAPTAKGQTKTTEHGVKYETIREGTGAELKSGQTGRFHYVGKFEDGKEFDSSRAGQPRAFTMSGNAVIKGWLEGLPGMKVGEIRKLTIPPDLAYGAQGKPPAIPPNATLLFEVELIDVL
jgi:FKBP-type peptidyl-prolyl cis-trans isomerase